MKTLLYVFLAIFPSFPVFCQSKLQIAMEGGPNYSTFRGNSILEEYNDSRIGFYSGLCFQYNFSAKVGIRTGIAFERKGSHDKHGELSKEFR